MKYQLHSSLLVQHSMKYFTTFKEMLPWLAWTIISLSWSVYAEISDHCRRPEITSSDSRPPFLVYQQTATVNVTVYHCQYLEENVCDSDICSNCLTGIPEFTVIGSSTYRYSDITQNCLESFSNKTAKFKDKFSFPHSNNTRFPYTYSCHNNTKLLRTISAVLTKYDAEAHIGRDEIVLKSGTVCRYSSGFCHDEKEDIDVMWQVQSGFHCHRFKTINTSDSYYFKLNQKLYAIIELYGKYSALELKPSQIKCNVSISDVWETQHQGLIVAEKPISNASNIPLQTTDYLGFSFQEKQDLYDFLTGKCFDELYNTNSDQNFATLFAKLFLNALEMKYQRKHNDKLNTELRRVRFHLDIAFYVIVFIVISLASVVILLIYCSCKKFSAVDTHHIPEPRCSKPIASISNNYEYISTEYDINSIYLKK